LIVMLGIGAGFFLWQNQKDVKEVNKNLPAGIKVVKGLFSSDDYVVVNKIDGYEFKLPKEWKGVKDVEYTPERELEGSNSIKGTSIVAEGKEGSSIDIAIDRYKKNGNEDLGDWAKNLFSIFGLSGNFSEDKVGQLRTVKVQEEEHLLGLNIYFFEKNNFVYVLSGGSEDFIKYIIENGKW